jgi:hypothetical protein
MFSCFGKKKRISKNKVTSTPIVNDFEDSADTDEDIPAESEWVTSQYESNEFNTESSSILKIEKILGQRTCSCCRYLEYHISFKTLCIPAKDYKAFAKRNSILKATPFSVNEIEYFHVECAPTWVSETDMLYIPFAFQKKYNFILLAKSSDCYEINYCTCFCTLEKRLDPGRWEYYKSYKIS